MSTQVPDLLLLPLDELCRRFLALETPSNELELNYYFKVAGVMTWAFLQQVAPFTIREVFDHRDAIMMAMVGPTDDSYITNWRIVRKLHQSRLLFKTRIQLLAMSVVEQAPTEEYSVEGVTEMLQTLSTNSSAPGMIALSMEALRSFRDAYEAIITWVKLVNMTNVEVRELMLKLITHLIPLARYEELQGKPHASVRLELFKDLLAIITETPEVTDTEVENLFRDAGMDQLDRNRVFF